MDETLTLKGSNRKVKYQEKSGHEVKGSACQQPLSAWTGVDASGNISTAIQAGRGVPVSISPCVNGKNAKKGNPQDFRTPSGSALSISDGASASLLVVYKQVKGEDPESTIQAKTERKRRSLSLGKRIAVFDTKRGERMQRCGDKLRRIVTKCAHRQTVAYYISERCGDRLCPDCARVRSGKLVGRLSDPLLSIAKENNLHLSLVTLTLTHTDKLPDWKALQKWKRAILRSAFWKPYGLFGTIGSLEAKIGEGSGKWNCHYHLIAFTENAIPLIETGEHAGRWQVEVNQSLSEAWNTVNGGSGYIVDGRAFNGNFQEGLQYISKGIDTMSDEHLREFCEWSRGKRFVSMTGKLYNNPALKELMKEVEQLNTLEMEQQKDCGCSECGCHEYEMEEMSWKSGRRGNYVLDRIEPFKFPLRE